MDVTPSEFLRRGENVRERSGDGVNKILFPREMRIQPIASAGQQPESRWVGVGGGGGRVATVQGQSVLTALRWLAAVYGDLQTPLPPC